MDDQTDLITKKPVHIFKRLKLDPKKTIKAIGKAVISGVKQDYYGVATNIWDGLTEISPAVKAQYAAWALIYNALTRSITLLVEDYRDLFDSECSESTLESVTHRLDEELQDIEIDLDLNFFNQPEKLEFFNYLEDPLCFWLTGLGLKEHEARALFYRLKNHFVISLHKCWLDKSTDYQCIENALTTPFVQAQKKQREWMQYNAWLKDQVKQRMFAEAFSLEQIYVKLRAFHLHKSVTKDSDIKIVNLNIEANLEATLSKSKKVVVDIHEELLQWVNNFNANDSIRVVSGGPGSGKSSFAKMFAAQIVTEVVYVPVLFIPLHHFKLKDDLISSIESFVKNHTHLSHNPFAFNGGEDRLLLIFDGLDELSNIDKSSTDTAEHFLAEVIENLNIFNEKGLKHQALITSRDLVIEANSHQLYKDKQILHLLPYYTSEDDLENYIDKERLLAEDQRDLWWEKYAKVSNKTYKSMPDELKADNLAPITQEPLLNYLVALSYEENQIQFRESTTLNKIYADLLNSIYERQWEGQSSLGRKHASIGKLTHENFEQVLEVIALSTWHGNGRTASEEEIFSNIKSDGLKNSLEAYQTSIDKGISKLLTAFYFRRSNNSELENKSFEFTHKSFSEYLVAKRIVRLIKQINLELSTDNIRSNNPNTSKVLTTWVEVTGPTEINRNIYLFLQNEIQSYPLDILKIWQKTFGDLLRLCVCQGVPTAGLEKLDFKCILTYTRNAEEMLLVVHSACALITKEVLLINWQGMFSEWLLRIIGNESVLLPAAKLCLQYLNLESENFAFYNFTDANLTGSNLRNTNLYRANLHSANLDSVDFTDTNLKGAVLTKSKLCKAKIINADLKGAQFGIDFQDCGASLYRRTRIQRRGLRDILEDAILDGSDLEGAFLRGVRFVGTSLNGTNLKHTRLISDSVATDKFNEHTVFPEGIDKDKCLEAHRAYILRTYERELYSEINTDHEDD